MNWGEKMLWWKIWILEKMNKLNNYKLGLMRGWKIMNRLLLRCKKWGKKVENNREIIENVMNKYW